MNDDSTQLWPYTLALYARPGVEATCLILQDDGGAEVVELLWACWLYRHRRVPGGDAAQHLAEVRRWQRENTHPLRQRRRALKAELVRHPQLAELRETLKRAELLAEREALERLAALAEAGSGIRPREADDRLPDILARLVPRPSHVTERALQRLADAADAEPGPPC